MTVNEATQPADSQQALGPRALCLSGGGYRAALFHLGVLTRLNEIGALGRFDTISSVSGGSILSGFLVTHLAQWPTEGSPVADWNARIRDPFCVATGKDVRTGPVLKALVQPWRSDAGVHALAKEYSQVFGLGDTKVVSRQAIRPRMLLNATDMQFGMDFVFDTDPPGAVARCGDYFAGFCDVPADWPLKLAVAASSCFPPVFNPLKVGRQIGVHLRGGAAGDESADQRPGVHPLKPSGKNDPDELRRELSLSDGGVYDNLGVRAIWGDHNTVLASDGGSVFGRARDRGLLSRFARYEAIAGHGGSLVRREWLMERFKDHTLAGAYLGIGSSPKHFPVCRLSYSLDLITDFIAPIRTDLDSFNEYEQGALLNHGYSLADAAIASYLPHWDTTATPPAWPVPDLGDGAEALLRKELRNSGKRKVFGIRI